MERILLFLVIGALFTGSMLSLDMQKDAGDADDALSEYQYKEFAREAAHAGLRATVRKLAQASNAPWAAPGSFSATRTAYREGAYEVTVTGVGTTGDTVDVYVTGMFGPDSVYVDARYKRAFDTEGIPPAFRSVILTDTLLQISGNITVTTLSDTYNANVHTNGDLDTNGNAFLVEGYGTYSRASSTKQPDNFVPKTDYNGAESNVLQIPPIEIPNAAMDSTHPDVTYIEPSGYLGAPKTVTNKKNTPILIDVRTKAQNLCALGEIPPGKCADGNGDGLIDLGRNEPFVWWVRGQVDLQNLEVTGNTVIYADADRMTNGGTPTPGAGIGLDQRVIGELYEDASGSGIGKQTHLMLRTPGSVDVYGNDEIVASIWANEQVTFHGTPDMIGNILSPEAYFEGKGDFTLTYAAPSSIITKPGYSTVYPVGPILIGFAEWDEETVGP